LGKTVGMHFSPFVLKKHLLSLLKLKMVQLNIFVETWYFFSRLFDKYIVPKNSICEIFWYHLPLLLWCHFWSV